MRFAAEMSIPSREFFNGFPRPHCTEVAVGYTGRGVLFRFISFGLLLGILDLAFCVSAFILSIREGGIFPWAVWGRSQWVRKGCMSSDFDEDSRVDEEEQEQESFTST
jgi:hypothetical protein